MVVLFFCLLENFAFSGTQKYQLHVPKLFISLGHIFQLLKNKTKKTKTTQATMIE